MEEYKIFGCLVNDNGKIIYVEKHFIVSNDTRNQKRPLKNIILTKDKIKIKKHINRTFKEENLKEKMMIRTNEVLNLKLYNIGILLIDNNIIDEKIDNELIDNNKIEIIKYYKDIMLGNKKSYINKVYYDILSVFENENIELENKLIKQFVRR